LLLLPLQVTNLLNLKLQWQLPRVRSPAASAATVRVPGDAAASHKLVETAAAPSQAAASHGAATVTARVPGDAARPPSLSAGAAVTGAPAAAAAAALAEHTGAWALR
jgi:hypothetical protein